MTAIRPKERDAIIGALRAGVVPRAGLRLIQVGRAAEIEAQIKDIDRIADGGSSFKIVAAPFGSGKSFFQFLTRLIAQERKLVTMFADLSPQRRLSGSNGQARSLYKELTRNMATRSKPDGDALKSVLERFVSEALEKAAATGAAASQVVMSELSPLRDMVSGFDFATVVAAYARAFQDNDDVLAANAMQWLRGEFPTKTLAREALGVRTIVDDDSVYDFIKLFARFARIAGYGGLLVCLDEMGNLFNIPHKQARDSNYEEILRMLNDTLQGNVEGLGFILCGPVPFLADTRRGMYSYGALQSRLAENSFAVGDRVDLTGPVLRLSSLSAEEYYVLLTNIRHVYAYGEAEKYLVPDDAIKAFMSHLASRLGDAYFRSPRNTITAFVNFLAVVEQNPAVRWQDLVGEVRVEPDAGDAHAVVEGAAENDPEFAEFKI